MKNIIHEGEVVLERLIIPYPYTYTNQIAVKCYKEGIGTFIRWFHLTNFKELPPYVGYGEKAQKEIDEWESLADYEYYK